MKNKMLIQEKKIQKTKTFLVSEAKWLRSLDIQKVI